MGFCVCVCGERRGLCVALGVVKSCYKFPLVVTAHSNKFKLLCYWIFFQSSWITCFVSFSVSSRYLLDSLWLWQKLNVQLLTTIKLRINLLNSTFLHYLLPFLLSCLSSTVFPAPTSIVLLNVLAECRSGLDFYLSHYTPTWYLLRAKFVPEIHCHFDVNVKKVAFFFMSFKLCFSFNRWINLHWIRCKCGPVPCSLRCITCILLIWQVIAQRC